MFEIGDEVTLLTDKALYSDNGNVPAFTPHPTPYYSQNMGENGIIISIERNKSGEIWDMLYVKYPDNTFCSGYSARWKLIDESFKESRVIRKIRQLDSKWSKRMKAKGNYCYE